MAMLPVAIGLGLVAADQVNQSIAKVPSIAPTAQVVDARQRAADEAQVGAAQLDARLTGQPPRVLAVPHKLEGQYPANTNRAREAVPFYPGVKTKKKTPQAFFRHNREWSDKQRGADPSFYLPLVANTKKINKHGQKSWRSDPFMDNAGRIIGADPGTLTKTVVPPNPLETRELTLEARKKFRERETALQNMRDVEGPVQDIRYSHRPSMNSAVQFEAPSVMRARTGVAPGANRISIYSKHRGTIDVPSEETKRVTRAENQLHTYKSGYWKDLDMPSNLKGTGRRPVIDFQGMFQTDTLNQSRYMMFHTGGKRKVLDMPRHTFSHATVIPGEYRVNGKRDASQVLAEPKKKKALGIKAPRTVVQHYDVNPHQYKTRHDPLNRRMTEYKQHTDMQAVALNDFIDTSSSYVNRGQKFSVMRKQQRGKVLWGYPEKQTWRPMEPAKRVEFIEAQKRNRYGVVPKYRN